MMLFPKQQLSLLGACILILVAPRSEALTVRPQPPKKTLSPSTLSNGFLAGVVSAVLLTSSAPAFAASDEVRGTPLEPAIAQLSEASYPILTSITDVSPLSKRFVNILDKKIPAPKASAALDKALDGFLTIPDEKVSTFAATLQSSYDGVSGDSCKAVAGTASTTKDFAALAVVQSLDSAKVKSLADKYASANQAVPKSASGDICLPASQKGLEDLWLGQTELTLNIPKAESKAFVGSLGNAVSTVPNTDWLKLVPEVKKTLTSNVDPKTATKFEKAGKALEKAFQSDARIQKRVSIS